MVNAQEFIDNIPQDQEVIGLIDKNLTGSVVIKDRPNLKVIELRDNKITSLTIINCPNIFSLDLTNNLLTDLNLPNKEKLTRLWGLWITNNNIYEQDLSIFSQFVNLEKLHIGNSDQERVNQGIYNRWMGSLEPLKNLTKLEELYIGGTDIDSGLEYLPSSLHYGIFGFDQYRAESMRTRPNCRSFVKFEQQLKPFNYNLRKWKQVHLDLVSQTKKSQQVGQVQIVHNEFPSKQ